MELTESTLNVLKNFSSINPNLMVREGNVIKTIAEARNILATAVIDTTFEQEFGIYDLNEFIGVLGLVDKPRLKFEKESVTIGDSSGRSKVKYFFSPEETLTTSQKDIKMPKADVSFVLTSDTLTKLKRAATALGHNELSITGKDGVIKLAVIENQNSTSNTFSMDIDGEFENADFNFIMSINNLRILPGDYDVDISSKLITQFKHKEHDVTYWIALEKSSTFGA